MVTACLYGIFVFSTQQRNAVAMVAQATQHSDSVKESIWSCLYLKGQRRAIMILQTGDSENVAKGHSRSPCPSLPPKCFLRSMRSFLVAALMTKEQGTAHAIKTRGNWHILAWRTAKIQGITCFSPPFEHELAQVTGDRPAGTRLMVQSNCRESPLVVILTDYQDHTRTPTLFRRLYEEDVDFGFLALFLVKENCEGKILG